VLALRAAPGKRLPGGRLAVAAVLIAALAALNLIVAGQPWGIVYGLGLWGAKIAQAGGADLAATAFWSAPVHAERLGASVLTDVTSLTNIGLIVGAFLIMRGRAETGAPSMALAWRGWAGVVLAGLVLGYSARIAFGCNVGAFFSGISTGSLHGWVWFAAAFAGSIAGLKLRPLVLVPAARRGCRHDRDASQPAGPARRRIAGAGPRRHHRRLGPGAKRPARPVQRPAAPGAWLGRGAVGGALRGELSRNHREKCWQRRRAGARLGDIAHAEGVRHAFHHRGRGRDRAVACRLRRRRHGNHRSRPRRGAGERLHAGRSGHVRHDGRVSEFCPEEEGGTIELTDAHVRCVISQTGSFEEIFEAAGEETPSPTATDLGDGTVRVSFPLGDVAGEAQEMSADPNMVAMFRPMMEGHSIVLRISGAEIVSSNGTISDDGTSAMLEIVLTDLLDGPETIPETFEAVVRY
jgi:hypothetical protein